MIVKCECMCLCNDYVANLNIIFSIILQLRGWMAYYNNKKMNEKNKEMEKTIKKTKQKKQKWNEVLALSLIHI